MRACGICSFLELIICRATLKTWIKSKVENPEKWKTQKFVVQGTTDRSQKDQRCLRAASK